MITLTISIDGLEGLNTQQVQVSAKPAVVSQPETPEIPENLKLDPQPVLHHIYCHGEKAKSEEAPPPIPTEKPPQTM